MLAYFMTHTWLSRAIVYIQRCSIHGPMLKRIGGANGHTFYSICIYTIRFLRLRLIRHCILRNFTDFQFFFFYSFNTLINCLHF